MCGLTLQHGRLIRTILSKNRFFLSYKLKIAKTSMAGGSTSGPLSMLGVNGSGQSYKKVLFKLSKCYEFT